MHSSTTYPRDRRVEAGLPVRFHSYRHAGVVGSVAESGFEVIRPDGERAWLRYDCIFSVIYSVRLICEEHGFDRWRLPGRRAG